MWTLRGRVGLELVPSPVPAVVGAGAGKDAARHPLPCHVMALGETVFGAEFCGRPNCDTERLLIRKKGRFGKQPFPT